ncbi:MAG: sugar phosphate isomerase/epimerase [Anaerolineae bacterium]|nr:sugar phosphate isomerase/epimerase [Anaerolineae bacterium]
MDVKKTMRIGCNPFYPIPREIDEDHQAEWFINRMADMGCRSAQTRGIKNDPALLDRVRALCRERDVELDCYAGGVFGLVGPNAAESRAALLESIAIAKRAGTNIIRTGYGHLNVATSRFSTEIPLAKHLQILIDNLKEAAKIVEDQGMYLAIENHCDFTGRQHAQVFEAVGSKHVGCALDTANGYTVFSDPDDDNVALAPYAITTHMKDMKIVDARSLDYLQSNGPVIPMLAIGVACGEGNVDLPLCLDELVAKCPHAEGLHLIVELGWDPPLPGMTPDESRTELFHRSVNYLKQITGQA